MVTKNYTYGYDTDDYVPNQYGVNDSDIPVLIGKVAYQIIKEVQTKDPLAVFDKVPVTNGDTIEQTVVKLVESTAYDPTGEHVLDPDTANRLAVKYFKSWKAYKYKATVYDSDLRKVMNPSKDYTEIASKLVSSLTQSDRHDKFVSSKGLLEYGRVNAVLKNAGTVAVDSNGVIDYKGILKKIKDTISGMTFVNSDYNTASLERSTMLDDIYIIMPYKLKNAMDVDELASVFNLDKTELGARIITVDTDVLTDAVDGTDPYVIYIVDQNAIQNYTRLYEMTEPVHNTDGRFWNYFLHVERMFALSQLFDGCYILANTKAKEENAIL